MYDESKANTSASGSLTTQLAWLEPNQDTDQKRLP